MSIRNTIEIATADANYVDSEKKLGTWTPEGPQPFNAMAEMFETVNQFMEAEGKIRGLPKRALSKIIFVFDKAE